MAADHTFIYGMHYAVDVTVLFFHFQPCGNDTLKAKSKTSWQHICARDLCYFASPC